MEFSEKQLQELKDKKIQVKDLDSRHFINASVIQDDHRENIKKLLNNDICSFQEIVDKFKSIKNRNNNPVLSRLLRETKFFKELIKNNKITNDDLKYLLNTTDTYSEVKKLCKNTYLLKSMIDNNIVSFQELVDKYKNIKDYANNSCLGVLLYNNKFFKYLIENNLISNDDLSYLLNKIDDYDELDRFDRNSCLLRYMIETEIVSFQELVDKYKNIKDYVNNSCLYRLLDNKELFESNKLNKEDLNYLLNRIDRQNELYHICQNTSLIKKILNEFLIDKELVDKFNRLLENNKWCKDREIHTVFDMIEYHNKKLIEYHNKNNEEILKLNELNRKIYSFELNENQRLELAEILRDNESAQSLLKQIVENNLQDQYDFESLKRVLTKDSEKKKAKLNL